jgi:hypothetical protein
MAQDHLECHVILYLDTSCGCLWWCIKRLSQVARSPLYFSMMRLLLVGCLRALLQVVGSAVVIC